MYNILIVDDEKDIVNALKIYLNNPDYKLFTAYNGIEALEVIRREEIHLILLDVMMPEMDGMTAMAQIRTFSNVPIILLTAKSEDTDKVLGLNIGADDYITKPFNPLELAARVNSQLRRYTRLGAERPQEVEVFTVGGIELNDKSKTVLVDGEEVALTPKEFDILKLLISSPGRVFSPKEIYRQVWQEDPFIGNDNTIAVHIRHLRKKIEINPDDPRYIKVVFGQGYKMERGRQV